MNNVPYPQPFKETVNFGGLTQNKENTFFLYGATSNGTFTSLRIQSGGSGYQVPVGKKLIVKGIRGLVNVTNASFLINIFCSTNDLGINGAGPATSPIYIYNANSDFKFPALYANDDLLEMPLDFEVPAGYYFGVAGGSGTGSAYLIALCEVVDT